jgi:hypothetical protein
MKHGMLLLLFVCFIGQTIIADEDDGPSVVPPQLTSPNLGAQNCQVDPDCAADAQDDEQRCLQDSVGETPEEGQLVTSGCKTQYQEQMDGCKSCDSGS